MAIQFNPFGSQPPREQALREQALHEQGRTDATTAKDARALSSRGTADEPDAHGDVALSAGARQLRVLADEVAARPAIDATRVDEIRRAIAAGRYHVDPVRLAEKFLALEGELREREP